MNLRLPSSTQLRAALLAGLIAAPSLLRAQAQEAGQGLSAETRSILGSPDSGPGLDADVVAVLGRPAGGSLSESAINELAADVATKLRCPVCQGVSIADSPSGMATKMRAQVRDLVTKGYSEEQVMTYFERSYGEFVRLEPPLRGLNVMLWILPGVVLLGGAFFVFRKANAPVPSAAPEGPQAAPAPKDVDPELAKYLERIRRDSGTSSQ
ncbi:MAG: cytochrome c-type biogenesis protein CcmH [Vicinamibacteria bacterium]|nr:cytochrome c-type biogenesis protein CcmH [Vicinamibacteria bacterium]